jgi:hypothetical protein
MICNINDFLLIVQSWVTDSENVFFVLRLLDDSNEPIFGFRLRGRVGSVDKVLPAFTFITEDDSEIVVDLAAWPQVGYTDRSAYPKGELVKEGFVIDRPGAQIAVWLPET